MRTRVGQICLVKTLSQSRCTRRQTRLSAVRRGPVSQPAVQVRFVSGHHLSFSGAASSSNSDAPFRGWASDAEFFRTLFTCREGRQVPPTTEELEFNWSKFLHMPELQSAPLRENNSYPVENQVSRDCRRGGAEGAPYYSVHLESPSQPALRRPPPGSRVSR